MSDEVTITYGADSESYTSLVGQDLGSAIKAARQLLQVSNDIEPRINGKVVEDEGFILKAGDEISFYKPSGTKGNE